MNDSASTPLDLEAIKARHESAMAAGKEPGHTLAAVISYFNRARDIIPALVVEVERLREMIDTGCCYRHDGCAEHRHAQTGDARRFTPGDHVRIGAIETVVVEGKPSFPHMVRTEYGDFAEHIVERIAPQHPEGDPT